MILIFIIGFSFSFIGSIPPGTINISVMQLSLTDKKWSALSFAIAAIVVEFGYAAFAVRFQIFLTENADISTYFRVISGSVLILLGVYNFFKKPGIRKELQQGEKRVAFVKGTLVALANPLSIPFWLAVTAYLQSMNWIALDNTNYLIYVSGISFGTLALLSVVIILSSRFRNIQDNRLIIYQIPGVIFIVMGLWTFINLH